MPTPVPDLGSEQVDLGHAPDSIHPVPPTAPITAPSGPDPDDQADPPPLRTGLTRRRSPAWWRAVRPRQWPKNLLVVAAPVAAGSFWELDVLAGIGVALVAFCLASSGCYLVNDVVDAEQDRRHPVKRDRPIASGEVSRRAALVVGVGLSLAAIALGATWDLLLGATIAAYALTQVAYVAGLKHQPAIDLAVVASGFLLRAVAGGVATGTYLSTWFLLMATFGALFVVAGKRYSEHVRLGDVGLTRPSLRHYSASYLRFVWTLAAGVTVVVHLLWALSGEQRSGGVPWEALSVAAFVLALLRYAARVDRGEAEHPEEIVLGDRALQVLGAVWVLLVVAGAVAG